MPQKNTIKEYDSNSYYHVYTRGINKQPLFIDPADYIYFLKLFERYLGNAGQSDKTGRTYPDYSAILSVEAYCFMRNHFHLLIYVKNSPEAMQKFMSSLKTSYSMYFNLKYKRVGAVFESRYKAKRISDESYLAHIHRYIHMNPRTWETYRHSSLKHCFADSAPAWLDLSLIESEYGSREEYLSFLAEYDDTKQELKILKDMLADQ